MCINRKEIMEAHLLARLLLWVVRMIIIKKKLLNNRIGVGFYESQV
jgi:hypothetical protein